MSEHVRISSDGGVLEIAFARPEKKNALTNAMYRAMTDALVAAESDKAIRAILFTAQGDAFSAGNDLADFANAANSEPQAGHFIDAIVRAKKPIVAAVQGLAVGVGTTMLLHCDLVYVADTAKLTTPFVNLALVPEAGSSILLPARIGHVRAFAMFALGEAMTGAEAAALGLANKALPADEVIGAARAAARLLATKPLGSLIATKTLMRGGDALSAQVATEARVFGERMMGEEAREAFQAFAERRPPDFTKFG